MENQSNILSNLSNAQKQLLIRCAVYCGLALVILLPLLRPGFILTLDMVFTPTIEIPASASGPSYIFWGILHLLNMVLPSATIQKMLLFAILFLSGFGMHRLLRMAGPPPLAKVWQWGCYFGGVLYMINPFTYDRFMAGQFIVLLGYALVPFFAVSLIKFCNQPTKRSGAWLTGWISLMAIVSLHALGLLVVLSAIVAAVTFTKLHRIAVWRQSFTKWGLLTLAGTALVNSYWLIPVMLGKSTTAQIVGSFTSADTKAFATIPGELGLFGNVFAMQGFWAEGKNLFLVPSDTYGWWLLPILLLWAIVGFGAYVSYKSRKSVSTIFLLTILLGACLAIGTAGTFVAPINTLLVEHVPFFAGYREPQKFVGLIVFGYSYFAAVGSARFALWLREHDAAQHVTSVMVALLLVPFMCAPLMSWGFHGQLRAADYPVQWYAVRDMVAGSCTGDCKVLFLPWHLYMRYDFAGRIVANPSQKFFGDRIIASNDPEMEGAASYRTSQDQKVLGDHILPAAEHDASSLAKELKARNIRFILLAKENDYKRYSYLDGQKDIRLVHDIPHIKLYEVK